MSDETVRALPELPEPGADPYFTIDQMRDYAASWRERAEKAEGLYKSVAALIAEYEDISLQGGITAAIKRMRDGRVAGERDTARLDWLQEMEGRGLGVVFGKDLSDVVKHGTLRETIDAAMEMG